MSKQQLLLSNFYDVRVELFFDDNSRKSPDPENKEIIIAKAIFRIIVVLFSRLF